MREQRKVPGSLSEGSVLLTKKVWRLRSFLKEKSGRWLKILEMLESELSKLKLRLTMGLIELLIGWKVLVMVNGMRSMAALVLGVTVVVRSIKKALCVARSTIPAKYCRLMKKEGISIHLLKKSSSSLQRRLKRRKGTEFRVCFWCENEYNKYEWGTVGL